MVSLINRIFMKKVIFLFSFLCALCACSDLETAYTNKSVSLNKSKELVAYPMRNLGTRSTVSSEVNVGDWENWKKVKLVGVDSVSTPWNDLSTPGCVPKEIREDIKYKDGWRLIAHTVNGRGEMGLNYLIFYNKYSGILKGFYYLEQKVSVPNNTGIWHLHFEQPQALLAFSNPIVTTTSSRGLNDIYIVNVTNQASKAFSPGWNCFQTELAYDPNFSVGSLQIIPMNMSSATINMGGSLEAYTNGTIISTTTSNPLNGVVKAVANLTGKTAEKWVKSAIDSKKFSAIGNAVINGAGSIVKSGAASLLGSFIGAFDKNNQTTQTVQLHTAGSVTLNGEIKTLQSSTIMPLSMSISIKDVGRLGVWCFTKTPKIFMNPYACLIGKDPNSSFWFKYRLEPVVDYSQTACVTLNPDLRTELGNKSVSVSFTPYLSRSSKSEVLSGKSYPERYAYISKFNNLLYEDTYSSNGIYYTISLPYFDKNGNVLENIDEMFAPYEIFFPDAPDNHKGACPDVSCPSHYKFIYGVRLNLKNGDTVQLYHTIFPDFEWDYDYFKRDKMYLHEYPTIPIGEYPDE